jgi:hypothetical protein
MKNNLWKTERAITGALRQSSHQRRAYELARKVEEMGENQRVNFFNT